MQAGMVGMIENLLRDTYFHAEVMEASASQEFTLCTQVYCCIVSISALQQFAHNVYTCILVSYADVLKVYLT